ncbi:MAG: glycoside hydrolase family 97 N-terminal domain-containing protein, partial [Kiritimatiellae bacterium]|nr:glycoside hydrolase family 97 N-terminal domain-containing protein [Kiritimatiellia bacterium]
MKTIVALLLSAMVAISAAAESVTCVSPDGKNIAAFDIAEKGEPTYSFSYRGKTVVEPSTLGFDIKALGKDAFEGRKPGEMRTGFS